MIQARDILRYLSVGRSEARSEALARDDDDDSSGGGPSLIDKAKQEAIENYSDH